MNAIKTARVVLLGLVLSLGISACGSSRYTILEPASEPLESFSVLEIHEFTSNLNDADSVDLANRFASQLYAEVLENRKENPGDTVFDENILFTHRGLSGPAALQISSYWTPGETLSIDLLPGDNAAELLLAAKSGQARALLRNVLAAHLPGFERLDHAVRVRHAADPAV